MRLPSPANKSLHLPDSRDYRPGSATETNSCQDVREVPLNLRSASFMKPDGLDIFYQKYTEAYGILVVSSKHVPDDALRRACYVLRFMLADHSVVREWVYRMSGRIGVMGKDEVTNDIPEHRHYSDWWNRRTRGLGSSYNMPVTTAGEENILCYQKDNYRSQDIMVHELSHCIHFLGAAVGIQGWDGRLRAAYAHAKKTGLFEDTYFMENAQEYFAEGVQSYFNVQKFVPYPDGVQGPIATRDALKDYDPDLYNVIKEIFPCDNTYLKRCESNRTQEDAQQLRMNCEPKGRCKDNHPACEFWSGTNKCTENQRYMSFECRKSCGICTADENCFDEHVNCGFWASTGECAANPDYMLFSCKKSCKVC
ncbi:hypothetical protein RRG08_053657 [Elysia crispata]|uniref:ShKT domain-containing protein n=1 Tax=Elysia crispata TaxID=231223 RepID=A0AAE0ZQ08_9GAST|nr:hypothetical protein RRG08_053657 [Elysia crispata]